MILICVCLATIVQATDLCGDAQVHCTEPS